MRAVVQRVSQATVTVQGGDRAGEEVARIGLGLLVLLGVTHDDTEADAHRLADKVWSLRILRDERSVSDSDAAVLVVSQFTLYGDARKGRRPTWAAAAPGPVAEPLYEAFCARLRAAGAPVEQGVFGADMAVSSINDGPTTLLLEI